MVLMGILLFAGPAAGPTLGGVLIGAFGWPSIFLVNLPFGILGLLGALQWRPSRSLNVATQCSSPSKRTLRPRSRSSQRPGSPPRLVAAQP